MARKYVLGRKDGGITEYPSVTTILDDMLNKPFLTEWKVKETVNSIKEKIFDGTDINEIKIRTILENYKDAVKIISEKALDIGSAVHDLIENHVKTGVSVDILSLPFEKQSGWIAFTEWEMENVDTWLESERTVWSNTYKYAGTLDGVYINKNNETCIVDFKTSSAIYPEYGLQLCAYMFALHELGLEVDRCGILRLDKKTGIPEFVDFTDGIPRFTDCFLHLVQAWWLFKKRRLKADKPAEEVIKYEASDM